MFRLAYAFFASVLTFWDALIPPKTSAVPPAADLFTGNADPVDRPGGVEHSPAPSPGHPLLSDPSGWTDEVLDDYLASMKTVWPEQ